MADLRGAGTDHAFAPRANERRQQAGFFHVGSFDITDAGMFDIIFEVASDKPLRVYGLGRFCYYTPPGRRERGQLANDANASR